MEEVVDNERRQYEGDDHAVENENCHDARGDDNEEDRVGAEFVIVPLPVSVVPMTSIQRSLVSHVLPEEFIVKLPSISIGSVDCVTELLSIT